MNENHPLGPQSALARVVGLPGAVLLGLGSILGTGIFVGIGVAAGVAGSWVVLSVALAAVVAVFNGLSSAQLAARHPVSGGTYEYGHRWIGPSAGFTAGWTFMVAKSASAATAALGVSGYLLHGLGVDGIAPRVVLAVTLTALLTWIVSTGIRRSNRANALVVGMTLVVLGAFVVTGFVTGFVTVAEGAGSVIPDIAPPTAFSWSALLHGTALMFVAYTGYGRIATLGEEVQRPDRTIPRAIVLTLVVTMVLYVAVTWVSVGAVGADGLAAATRAAAAPLEVVAQAMGVPWLAWLVALGAITAMLGVLLNLLLGLSRVLLAMSRRGDMPRGLAELHGAEASPRRAVVVVGVVIALLALTGDVRVTWSFSAFTVLIYYAITNWAALRMSAEERRYPRVVAAAGLLSCLGLAFFIDPWIWLVGLGVIGAGHAGRRVLR